MKINYLAVMVCGVAHWMLGALWYGNRIFVIVFCGESNAAQFPNLILSDKF